MCKSMQEDAELSYNWMLKDAELSYNWMLKGGQRTLSSVTTGSLTSQLIRGRGSFIVREREREGDGKKAAARRAAWTGTWQKGALGN